MGETRWNCKERNAGSFLHETDQGLDVFSQLVRPLGAEKFVTLDENVFVRAQWYVLSNCKEMSSYLE